MALTYNIDITTHFSRLNPNKKLTIMIGVTNTGASSVTMAELGVVLTPISASANIVQPRITSDNETISAGATNYYRASVVFFEPQNGTDDASPSDYQVSAWGYDDNDNAIEGAATHLSVSGDSIADETPVVAVQALAGSFIQDEVFNSGDFGFFW